MYRLPILEMDPKEVPRPMAHQHRLPGVGRDRHHAHLRLQNGSADGFGICSIGFTPFDAGLDARRRDQQHLMAEHCQCLRPVMRPGAGVLADDGPDS